MACAGGVLGFLLSRQVYYSYMVHAYVWPDAAAAAYENSVRPSNLA